MKPSVPCMEANDPAAQFSFPNTACSSRAALRASGANLPLHLMRLGQHFSLCCQPTACSGICRQSWHGVLCQGQEKRDGLLFGCPHQGCLLVIRSSPSAQLHCRKFVPIASFPTFLPSPCRLGRSQHRKEALRSCHPSSQQPQCLQPDPSTALQGAKPKGETPAAIRIRNQWLRMSLFKR